MAERNRVAGSGGEGTCDVLDASVLSGSLRFSNPTHDESAPAEMAPTRAARPGRNTGSLRIVDRQTGDRTPQGTSAVPLTVAALLDEEMARARVTTQAMVGIILLGLAVLPLTNGDPLAKRVALVGALIAMVVMLLILRNTRDRARYSTNYVSALSMLLCPASMCALYYVGAFSAASTAGVLSLYIVSLSESARWAIALSVGLASSHSVLALAIIGDLIQDRGLIRSVSTSVVDQLAMLACMQAMYALAFVAGRATRSKMERMVRELETGVRQIARRDALLDEAKRELGRANRANREGRFTGHVIGSFRLGEVIGRGGMGEVYDAKHVDTDQSAAVKLLQWSALERPEAVARFAREAMAAARVDSPYVARVIEVPGEEAPLPYVAMERLQGDDLAGMLRSGRLLSGDELATLADQVGAALDAARAAGVIHRDMKPQNLFFAHDPERPSMWKVLDFGVSKVLEQATLTQGELIGTPEYMAPEQARGQRTDHRTDLYGLCAVLYRCIVGRAPFSGGALAEIIHKVTSEMPRHPQSLRAVSADLEAFLAIGLAKRPEDRFESGAELAATLRSSLRGQLPQELRGRATRILAERPWSE